ncbi:GntR family transcriptional regulator [Corynebacterium mastitidis]|uniref:GntR family transcriptional regulator n=1 Tax=Corynebacterium mastitidis TaxID=161890 RepID=A0A2N0XA13_9CORY|nr:GntR family transcriptional regulator [Corynebacterium mastitidis]MCH6197409.1 GntR family transcriptional regulator [Corynebacterium mastitidis]PKF69553.1 GntR family transcriptional regulator [Corynebacterium mastitidis]
MRAAQAAERLRRAIAAGDFRPGDRLREVEAARRLGVSRNTLREAFAMLAAEGLVTREPNRGVFLASPTADDVRSLYAARIVLEPAALCWGGAADAEALLAAVRRAEDAHARGDLAEVAQANQAFHQEIVAATGSDVLARTMQQLLARMRLVFLSAERRDPRFHGGFIEDNRRVAEALAAGTPARAAELLRASLARTRDLVAEMVEP